MYTQKKSLCDCAAGVNSLLTLITWLHDYRQKIKLTLWNQITFQQITYEMYENERLIFMILLTD